MSISHKSGIVKTVKNEKKRGGKTVGASRKTNYSFYQAEHLELAIRSSNVGLWDWDLTTNKVYFSREWKAQLGYGEDEINDDFSEWESRVHPEDLRKATETINAFIRHPYPNYHNEFRMRHKDGTYRWILAQASLISNEQGKPLRMIGSHIDISASKRAELELKESEKRFSTAFFTSPISQSIISQSTGSVIEVNDRCCELYGYGREELIDAKPDKFELWADPAEKVAVLAELKKTGHLSPREVKIRRKSGDIGNIIFSVEQINWQGMPCWITSSADITERKRAEIRVQRLTRLYATLSQTNQAIVKAKSRKELFSEVCRVCKTDGGFQLAWVGELDEKTGHVTPVAAQGLELVNWPFDPINIRHGIYRNGLVATAIKELKISLSGKIKEEKRTSYLSRFIDKFNFQSSASIPLLLQGRVFGVLNVVADEVGFFTDAEEIRLLEEIGGDISYALDVLQMEEAKKENERITRQWADAFTFCTHGIAIGLPESSTLLTCNPKFAQLQRRTISEVEGIPILAMYLPEEHEKIKQNIADADRFGTVHFESVIVRKDGTHFPVAVDLASIRDGSGKVIYRVATHEDITERKLSEATLIESEKKFRTLYESMQEGMALHELVFNRSGQATDYRILDVNPAFEKIVGLSREQVIDRLASQVYGTTIAPYLDIYIEVTNTGKPTQFETTFDPLHKTFEISVFSPGKNQFATIFQDVTQRKLAEKSLHDSEQRFSTAFQSSPVAIGITRLKDGILLNVNESFCELFGFSRAEVIGHSALELGIIPDESTRKNIIGRVKSEGSIINQNEVFRNRQGDSKNILVNAVKVEIGGEECALSTLVDITERDQLLHEIRGRNEDLRLINALNDAANRGETLMGIVNDFAQKTRAAFNCQDVAVYLLNPEGNLLEMKATSLSSMLVDGIEKLIGQPIPNVQIPLESDSYLKKVFEKKEGTLSNDPEKILSWMGEFARTTSIPDSLRPVIRKIVPAILKFLGTRSIITMPLVSSGKVIGLLDMASKGQFTSEDVNRIREICRQVTAVILRKHAEEHSSMHLRQVEAMGEIDRIVIGSMDLDVTMELVLQQILKQLGIDAVSILTLDPVDQLLTYKYGKGFHTTLIQRSSMRVGQGQAGKSLYERRPFFCPTINIGDYLAERQRFFREEGFISYSIIPLVVKNDAKGVIELYHRSEKTFDVESRTFLEALGRQVAIAIDNAQLFNTLQKTNFQLITAYDATIEGWSRAMDLRDKETEGHTLRVTEVTLALAEKVGIPPQEMVHIRRGTLLHDIGKLGVPDEILNKPGELTAEEWLVMRQHPQFAWDMLSSIQYLRQALEIPYCHHEKWDGSGYPRGLRGEQIPIAARLFALVDVWDALTSDRPYRPAWPEQKVIKHIRSLSGSHFDPHLVGFFLDFIKDYGKEK